MHPLLQRVPRLQMLAVFESAARLGSFTAAADELGMSQPAVSRQIAGLEGAIGTTLFDRTANRASLNRAGLELLGAVQLAFDAVADAIGHLEEAGSGFLLAANPGFAQQWLLPNLDRLQDLVGERELRIRLFDRDGELREEPFDAAIHLAAVSVAPAGSRLLFEERVVPVASVGYAAAHDLRPTSAPECLVDTTKLHLDGRDRQWATWRDWFAGHGLSWRPQHARLSYNNYAVVLADAMNGLGVALAWRGLIEPHLDSGALVTVGPELQRPGMAYLLIPGPSAEAVIVDRLLEWVHRTVTGETPATSPELG